jgi:hypothetical protein
MGRKTEESYRKQKKIYIRLCKSDYFMMVLGGGNTGFIGEEDSEVHVKDFLSLLTIHCSDEAGV